MLIGVTTGSSMAQAGNEGISSASRRPSGEASTSKWSSPSKAGLVKPIEVSIADAATLRNAIKEVEAGLAKSEVPESQQKSLIGLIGLIVNLLGDKDNKSVSTKSVSLKSVSAKPIEVSPADAAMLRDKINEVEAGLANSKSGEVSSSQKSLIGLIRDLMLKPLEPSK
jgi:hypothetical protein